MTVFERKKFTYQKADFDTYEYESTVYGRELFNVKEQLLMIVRGNQKFGNYRDYNEEENTVRNLVNKRHAIVLDNDYNIYKKDITFYNEFIFINTDKFTYVKDFIDSVINYRFQNNLEQISEVKLLTLLREFILNHKQIIYDNYHNLTIERQNELKEYFEQEQLKLYRQRNNN